MNSTLRTLIIMARMTAQGNGSRTTQLRCPRQRHLATPRDTSRHLATPRDTSRHLATPRDIGEGLERVCRPPSLPLACPSPPAPYPHPSPLHSCPWRRWSMCGSMSLVARMAPAPPSPRSERPAGRRYPRLRGLTRGLIRSRDDGGMSRQYVVVRGAVHAAMLPR